MIPDRVTSKTLFHVRSPDGVTLELTPDEAHARAVHKAESPCRPSIYKLDRTSGVAVKIA